MTDPWSEKIFDSLLEEMLTNKHPPDLSEQIQQRIREELGHAQAAPRATSQRSSNSHNSSSHRHGWRSASIAVLALAAGLLMALSVRQLWLSSEPREQLGSTNADTADKLAGTEGAATSSNSSATVIATSRNGLKDGQAANSNGAAADQVATGNQKPNATAHEDLPLDNLPFRTDDAGPAFRHEPTDFVAVPVKALSDQEIVASIDEKFAALWDREGLPPSEPVDSDVEAARIALVLTGEMLEPSAAPPRELSSKLVRSATFAEHWAERVVSYWSRGTPANGQAAKDRAALQATVAQQIVARRPWNEILAGLIDSQPDQPEAGLLTLLAGDDNHRMVGRLGATVLDEALACARCHDASDNGRLITTDQEEYWSLVAIFTGIDTKRSPDADRKVLVDRQSQLFADGKAPSVFFERPDGRLQAAHYRLPAGDNWRSIEGSTTPRQSLARWIATTSVTDHAAVNTAWRLVYGRPLVAQHAALDGEGWAERREILDILAQQFQAHGRDMAQLVDWVISSAPFRTQTLAVDRQQWLVASEADIARWNLAAVNFAAFAPPAGSSKQLQSLESALVSVIRWSGAADQRSPTLAQPGPATANNKARVPSGSQPQQANDNLGTPPPTYLVRSVRPSAAQSEFIKRLVSSKLTWPQQVEHIAGLIGDSCRNNNLQRTADQVLELKNGDRSAALYQLLQSALLCDERL